MVSRAKGAEWRRLLVLAGDEDEACQELGLMLKRNISAAVLAVLPRADRRASVELIPSIAPSTPSWY